MNYPVRKDKDVHLLNVPDKMLTELVLGTDEPASIAAKYGFDDVAFELLEQQDSFKRAIASRTAELEGKGEIFKVKARALADDLLENVYLDAKTASDPKVRLDALKFLATAGGVAQPVQQRQDNAGPKFSITFNLSGGAKAQVNFQELFSDNNDLIIDAEDY